MNTEKNVKFIQGTESVNSYLKTVRRYDVLSDSDEKALFEQYANGDLSARDKIILSNQRFLYSQAKIYAKNEEDIMDYVSEGNIGMLEVIEEFDYTKGFKFITFAVWYIKRAMNSFMTNQRDCIVKSNAAKYGKKIDKIKNEFYLKNERYPYPDEIAEIMSEKYGIEVVNLIDLYDLNIDSINNETDDDVSAEEVSEFAMQTASYNDYEVEKEASNDDLIDGLSKNLLNVLSARYKDIVCKYFGIGGDKYSIFELSMEYNLPENIVKTIVDKSLQYMKQEFKKNPSKFTTIEKIAQ
jgi:RNA polymerase primary sigma factor